jgi:uncharacterized protein
MADLYVSWTDYHLAIERLARKVYDSKWAFNQILCIARGGLRIGDVLSRIYDQPLAIISTSSYTENAGTVRGEITVASHITMTSRALGDRILLVDDLVDSGVTLNVVKQHLFTTYPATREVKTAVLWWKQCSKFTPDYHVDYLAENPWIHQPFEPYDQMEPADLVQRVKL